LISDTKRADKKLIRGIKAGKYTYILLSPEQAASKVFRGALKGAKLQETIGLVAINECHLIK
jgi:superfamily II DNA helicase RecQ